jgi:hypothetical protein
MQRKFLGFIKVDFDATGQLLIIHSAFVKYWRKKWEYTEAVHKLFIDYKKVHDSLRREALYNIIIEFVIPMQGEVHTGFCWGNPRERDHLKYPGLDGKIILRWI